MASDGPYDTDRPTGFLSSGQREHLIEGPAPDVSENALKQRRYRISTNARNAILDFTLLLDELDANSRGRIQDMDKRDATTFLIQSYIRRIANAPDLPEEEHPETSIARSASTVTKRGYVRFFEAFLEDVISRAFESEDNPQESVSVSLDIPGLEPDMSVEGMKRKVAAGKMDPIRVTRALAEGEISPMEFAEISASYPGGIDPPAGIEVPVIRDGDSDDADK